MIPFNLIKEQMDMVYNAVSKPRDASVEIEPEPVVDVAEGEEQMELYSIVSGLERASHDQLRVIFGEMKPYKLNDIQRVLDEMRDVPSY